MKFCLPCYWGDSIYTFIAIYTLRNFYCINFSYYLSKAFTLTIFLCIASLSSSPLPFFLSSSCFSPTNYPFLFSIYFYFLLDIFFIYISNIIPFPSFLSENPLSPRSSPCSPSYPLPLLVLAFPYTGTQNLHSTKGLSSH